MTKTNILTEDYQTGLSLQSTITDEQKFKPTDIDNSSNTDNLLHGEMSKLMQNFDKMNTNEIVSTKSTGLSLTTDEQKFKPTDIIDNSLNTDNLLHGEMSKLIQNFDKMNTNEIVSTKSTGLSLQSTTTDEQKFKPTDIIDNSSNTDNLLHGEMSKLIQNFDKMNTNETVPTKLTNENMSFGKKLKAILGKKKRKTVIDKVINYDSAPVINYDSAPVINYDSTPIDDVHYAYKAKALYDCTYAQKKYLYFLLSKEVNQSIYIFCSAY
jgi:hypothetical protein